MPKKGEKCTEKQLAALQAGKKDFISGDERTKIIQAQGTKAAAIKRTEDAEKRTFAEHLAEALSITTADGKTRKHGIAEGLTKALENELRKKNPNGKTVNALYTAIRDTIGEMPAQKVDLNAKGNITIGNWREKLPTATDTAEDAAATADDSNATTAESTATEAKAEADNNQQATGGKQ